MKSREKVFLSYAKEDIKQARRIYDDLKKAEIDAWLDIVDLLPGQNWQDKIEQEIKKCRYFLALLSTNSVSKKGYVQREIKRALDLLEEFPQDEVYIIPVRLDSCEIIDRRLDRLQRVDLFSSYEKGIQDILRVLLPTYTDYVKMSTDADFQQTMDAAGSPGQVLKLEVNKNELYCVEGLGFLTLKLTNLGENSIVNPSITIEAPSFKFFFRGRGFQPGILNCMLNSIFAYEEREKSIDVEVLQRAGGTSFHFLVEYTYDQNRMQMKCRYKTWIFPKFDKSRPNLVIKDIFHNIKEMGFGQELNLNISAEQSQIEQQHAIRRFYEEMGGREPKWIKAEVLSIKLIAGGVKKGDSAIKEREHKHLDRAQTGISLLPPRYEPCQVLKEQSRFFFRLNEDDRPTIYIENRFEIHRNGTVTDHAILLMWQQRESADKLTHKEAQEYVRYLNLAGYTDWRLPTIDELITLLGPTKQANGLFISPIFKGEEFHCWSADTCPPVSGWRVIFSEGRVKNCDLTFMNYVRAVRSIKEYKPDHV